MAKKILPETPPKETPKPPNGFVARYVAEIASHLHDLSNLLDERQDHFQNDCLIVGTSMFLDRYADDLEKVSQSLAGSK